MNRTVLIIGACASGKSEYAEQAALRLHEKKPAGSRLLYAATMRCSDSESAARIEKHIKRRRDTAFETVEIPVDIGRICGLLNMNDNKPGEHSGNKKRVAADTILLECVSNLLANEMYDPDGSHDECVAMVVNGIDRISERADIVIVTNEVFLGGADYDDSTVEYMRRLGRVNRELALRADLVVEIVCGIPVIWKGKENAFN